MDYNSISNLNVFLFKNFEIISKLIFFSYFDFSLTMSAEPASNNTKEEIPTEPLFGTFDIILLVVLLGVGVWWLFFKNKKKDDPYSSIGKSYSIQ